MGTVRIISGRYRGRRLRVPDEEGLRPTTDRVRETLFNWLQFRLNGVRCLDLFAGSGALGLEAASRFAGQVVMTDRNPRAVGSLQENVRILGCTNVTVTQTDALQLVSRKCPEPYDVVFLDPPYHRDLLEAAARGLEDHGFLREGSLIYAEHSADESPALPASWQLFRSGSAGQCRFALYEVHRGDSAAGAAEPGS